MKNTQKFITEIFDPETQSFEEIKEDILSIEHEAFGEHSFPDEWFPRDFCKEKENVVVLLRGPASKKVIGFTYAKPITNEKPDTAFIWNTAIQKNFQHQGLVGLLMETLEKELMKRGFKYMEREAAYNNGYADKIAKHYKGRIVEQSEPHEVFHDTQVFFRIKL